MAGTVITTKGLQLIAKLVASGTVLTFTRASVGTGSIPAGYDPKNMTDLSSYKMDGSISSCSSSADEASIIMQISSVGVETGFTITETGLFAMDPDEGEILYAYLDLTKDPQYVYAEDSAISKFVEMTLIVKVGSVETVTAYLNPKSLVTRDGDISETVIETLDTVEDKYPIPAAGESVKRFFGKVLTFLRNIRPLTGDVNIYVSTTGSDTTGDGTSAKPFKTIQHAVDTVPKDLNGYAATINVSAGSYPEVVIIAAFYSGTLFLSSDTNGTIAGTCMVNTIRVRYSSAMIYINGFNCIDANDYVITASNCSGVNISYCQSTVATSKEGIYYNASSGYILGCKIANRAVALYVNAGLVHSSSWNTGSINNTTALVSINGAIISKYSNQPSGASAEWQSSGQIISQSGTQISGLITSGISCTWGTIVGGYFRHGNLKNGMAVVTITLSISLTSTLSAGGTYYISGFPAVFGGSVVAVSVHDKKDIYYCQINFDGVLQMYTFNTLTAGNTWLAFNCTYITDQ
ncbi:MAG: hypothetical protein F8N38_01285 [Hungatella sp.]|nr:hypothetical protein [Hungatella sp.]